MTTTFETLGEGDIIDGPEFAVSRESIRLFCDASLDYNPLHLDDDYMKGNFGKTNFGGIIMHGMNNFGLISRMITDWPTRQAPFIAASKPGGSNRSGLVIRSSPKVSSDRNTPRRDRAGCC